jgi:hypothetical protein
MERKGKRTCSEPLDTVEKCTAKSYNSKKQTYPIPQNFPYLSFFLNLRKGDLQLIVWNEFHAFCHVF